MLKPSSSPPANGEVDSPIWVTLQTKRPKSVGMTRPLTPSGDAGPSPRPSRQCRSPNSPRAPLRRLAGSLGLTGALLATPAPANERNAPFLEGTSRTHEAQSGFAYGLRLGASVPWGKTDAPVALPALRSGTLRDLVLLRTPLWLDLGYQLDAHWWLGLQTQLAVGLFGDDCPKDADCHFTELRLGAQVLYHGERHNGRALWGGMSLGWESLWASMTRAAQGLNVEVPAGSGVDASAVALTAKELLGGPQLTLEAGLDWELGESLTWGPYLSTAVGTYIRDSFTCPSALRGFCPEDREVEKLRVHGWVGAGLRLTHGP